MLTLLLSIATGSPKSQSRRICSALCSQRFSRKNVYARNSHAVIAKRAMSVITSSFGSRGSLTFFTGGKALRIGRHHLSAHARWPGGIVVATSSLVDAASRFAVEGSMARNARRNKIARGLELGIASSPMPEAPAPMLCTLVDSAFDSPDWTFEPKFDGLRVLARFDGA